MQTANRLAPKEALWRRNGIRRFQISESLIDPDATEWSVGMVGFVRNRVAAIASEVPHTAESPLWPGDDVGHDHRFLRDDCPLNFWKATCQMTLAGTNSKAARRQRAQPSGLLNNSLAESPDSSDRRAV
jgi:hypothetical protein